MNGFFAFLTSLFLRKSVQPKTPSTPAPPYVYPTQAAVTPGLIVLDASVLTVTLVNGVLRVKLTDDNVGAWMRLVLPDGTVSPVTTTSGRGFLGLGGNSAHQVAVTYLPGLRVEVGTQPDGPWKLVASTQ